MSTSGGYEWTNGPAHCALGHLLIVTNGIVSMSWNCETLFNVRVESMVDESYEEYLLSTFNDPKNDALRALIELRDEFPDDVENDDGR